MSLIKELFKNKIQTIAAQKNLTTFQKKKRLGAFVNNVLYIIDTIQTKENKRLHIVINDEFTKNQTGDYSWISMSEFEKKIKDRGLLQECKTFLKDNSLIDVLMKDGKEYFCHWANEQKGLHLCSKAYKLTDKCKQIFANTTPEEFDQFIKQVGITERKYYTQPTPKEVMSKVKDEYWFKNTKANIEHVFNNNLELEFHPTSIKELVELYNQQRKTDGEKEASKEEIELEISHRIDQYANKDFSYNVRLYNAFTNTPRSWRKFVTGKDGKTIDELFDIHSSVLNILPLVCRIVLLKDGCNKQTFLKFEAEEKVLEFMLQKDVYTTIAAGRFTRQEIKNALMKVLFSNNKSFENVANIELTAKGKNKKTAANCIRIWLRDNFPIMFDVLAHFEEKQVKNAKSKWTKKKSQYWKAFQQLETELMCELIVRVEKKFGIKVYSIHDGCFCQTELYSSEKNEQMVNYCQYAYNQLKDELKKLINDKYKNIQPKENKVENSIILVQTEPALDEAALTALMQGTEQFI